MKLESFKSIFFKALMSGFMIGIGGTVYLMCDRSRLSNDTQLLNIPSNDSA